jgi:GTP-binding protein YchF
LALKIGIVGLPNVGKSTLFNALTKSHAAQAANYPFCTIDPNIGIVEVPDERIAQLAQLYTSQKIIPTAIEFVDIAGLVAGASKGEGLGNKFLAHIREVDAIAHVVRDFVNPDIQHVNATPDAASDIETIETELILADLAAVEKHLGNAEKQAKSGDKKALRAVEIIKQIKAALENEKPASSVEVDDIEEKKIVRDMQLLTSKPMIYAVNVAEKDLASFDKEAFRKKVNLPLEANIVGVSAQIESELVGLSEEEAAVFLTDLGLTESSLKLLIREAYKALGLITFLTAGEKEVRAWTINIGDKAPQAAGRIHTDFEKGFIRAEIIPWEKLVEAGSEAAARERGWLRSEGKEYIMQDGDVCEFRFNV